MTPKEHSIRWEIYGNVNRLRAPYFTYLEASGMEPALCAWNVIGPYECYQPEFLAQTAQALREDLGLAPEEGPTQLADLWRLDAELHWETRHLDRFDIRYYREEDGSFPADILADWKAKEAAHDALFRKLLDARVWEQPL
jgi:hypothetical protein